MGFLDFLFDKDKAQARNIEKHKKKLTNMYVQANERQWIIQALRDIGNDDAVRALLARFKEQAPNTTVDVEEKQYVYDSLVDLSRSGDVDVRGLIHEYLLRHDEKINWPLKVMGDILSREQMVELLTELLSKCDTGYQRSTEKKQELILVAANHGELELHQEVARFTDDADETIRFLASDTLLKSDNAALIVETFSARYPEEDSIRILQLVTETFAEHKDWLLPEEQREAIVENLPEGYGLHKQGYIYKRRTA